MKFPIDWGRTLRRLAKALRELGYEPVYIEVCRSPYDEAKWVAECIKDGCHYTIGSKETAAECAHAGVRIQAYGALYWAEPLVTKPF